MTKLIDAAEPRRGWVAFNGTRFSSGTAQAVRLKRGKLANTGRLAPLRYTIGSKASAIWLTPTSSPKFAARAGITLTQILVVISLTSVITMAAITTIISMLRQEGRTTQVWLSQQTLLRLSDDFRNDTHAARIAEITTQNNAPALIFLGSTETTKSVTYLVTEHQVTRRETDGDKLLRTESYRLPDSQVTFDSSPSRNDSSRLTTGETVRLTCRRPNAPPINQRTPPPLHDEHILAVLGRDHRFEKP
ncbi:MAG: hypothetical protein ACKV2Q_12965 [Planctomycetaceae bacterium]